MTVEEADPELYKKVASGDVPVNTVYRQIRERIAKPTSAGIRRIKRVHSKPSLRNA